MKHKNTRHGHASPATPTYGSWAAMHNRCRNKSHVGWNTYGGRGISVCEGWGSFEKFLEDMGERPEGHTLDRIDSDGNYEPDNCRWADPRTQRMNRKSGVRGDPEARVDYTESRITRGQAIREKCLDCAGYNYVEVRECPAHGCPLWPFRLGSEKRSRLHKTDRYVAAEHLPLTWD